MSKAILTKSFLSVLTAGYLLAGSSQVAAHHAFAAEFDADKPIDLKGTVTKIKWVNPHSWLYFDVTDAQGKVTNWGVEFGAPNQLAKIGLKKADVAPGTAVQIKGYLAKNGGPYGYSVIVTLPDGRKFQTGGAQDAPTATTAYGSWDVSTSPGLLAAADRNVSSIGAARATLKNFDQ